MAKTKIEIETLVEKRNQEVLEGMETMTIAQFRTLKSDHQKAIEDAIKEYNAESKKNFIAICNATESPILKAVELYSYERLGVKEENDDEVWVDEPKLTLAESQRQFDLYDINKGSWAVAVEKLNLLLTKREATILDGVIKSSNGTVDKNRRLEYLEKTMVMKKESRAYELGKTPETESEVLGLLQIVINKIVGDGIATAELRDAHALLSMFSQVKKTSGKDATVKVLCANQKKIRMYIGTVLHRIVTSKEYEVITRIDEDLDKSFFSTPSETPVETQAKPASETPAETTKKPRSRKQK